MPVISNSWGLAIRKLLSKHNLSTRGAMMRANGRPSHTTIKDWADGIKPTNQELVYSFLMTFPKEEGIECLRAGGFSIPDEWQDSTPTAPITPAELEQRGIADPVRTIEFALNGNITEDYQLEMIEEFLKKHRKK